jgi:hypothetical protein
MSTTWQDEDDMLAGRLSNVVDLARNNPMLAAAPGFLQLNLGPSQMTQARSLYRRRRENLERVEQELVKEQRLWIEEAEKKQQMWMEDAEKKQRLWMEDAEKKQRLWMEEAEKEQRLWNERADKEVEEKKKTLDEEHATKLQQLEADKRWYETLKADFGSLLASRDTAGSASLPSPPRNTVAQTISPSASAPAATAHADED